MPSWQPGSPGCVQNSHILSSCFHTKHNSPGRVDPQPWPPGCPSHSRLAISARSLALTRGHSLCVQALAIPRQTAARSPFSGLGVHQAPWEGRLEGQALAVGLRLCGQGILLNLEDGLEGAVCSMKGSGHNCAGRRCLQEEGRPGARPHLPASACVFPAQRPRTPYPGWREPLPLWLGPSSLDTLCSWGAQMIPFSTQLQLEWNAWFQAWFRVFI